LFGLFGNGKKKNYPALSPNRKEHNNNKVKKRFGNEENKKKD